MTYVIFMRNNIYIRSFVIIGSDIDLNTTTSNIPDFECRIEIPDMPLKIFNRHTMNGENRMEHVEPVS